MSVRSWWIRAAAGPPALLHNFSPPGDDGGGNGDAKHRLTVPALPCQHGGRRIQKQV